MIYEKIYTMDNLKEAWNKVKANRSPAGIDRVTPQDFEKNLSANLDNLQQQLGEATYRPLPVVLLKKLKDRGAYRVIGISTIRDRVAQQAILQIIAPYFEQNFLPCCYAYRAGKSALSAVEKASKLAKAGRLWALQIDVQNFFDTMDHSIVLNLISRVINEKNLLQLISHFLKAKIFKEMGLFDQTVGSQQGSGLSPLLSNIYMHPVDCFLWEKYNDNYLRYSDDIALFSDDKETLDNASKLIQQCLMRIKLTVNERKSTITHLSAGIVYLGYYIDVKGVGPDKKSVLQLEHRLSEYDKLRKTDSIADKLNEISAIIRGWHSYYKTLKPITPSNILSLLALAKLGRHFGQISVTKDLLKKSGEFKYHHPEVSFQLGELFESVGMKSHAAREYAKALELDPTMEPAKEKIRSMQELEVDVYQAIEKIQLVLHHNPAYREGYEKLAAYYAELGLYGFAEKAHQKALEIDPEPHQTLSLPSVPYSPDNNNFDYRLIDQDVFLSIFTGRKDSHAKQWIDERGRWDFLRVERPMKKKDVYNHLNGEITLAIFPVTEQDTVSFIVFDIDTVKRKLLESNANAVDKFRKEAHQDILRIKTVCKELNIQLYIEDSGYKGRHGWLFFSANVPTSEALTIGQTIMKRAGSPSEGMMWELFPMGKSDRHKSLIKLPLGLNRKNNRRCLFLTDNGEPIQDQGLVLNSLKKNDIEQLRKHCLNIDKPGDAAKLYESELPPNLKKMIDNCRVIQRLVAKSKDTNYLNHYERLCLLYTLTFAGKEGCAFLHKVISYCINYNPQFTQLQIEKRKEKPISCAKIMEYFPQLAESLPCDCSFKLPPKGYPSPTLYLIESEIEETCRIQPSKSKTQAQHPDDSQQEESLILDFEDIFSSDADAFQLKDADEPTQQSPSELDFQQSESEENPSLMGERFFDIAETKCLPVDITQEKAAIKSTQAIQTPLKNNRLDEQARSNHELNGASPYELWELVLEFMRLKAAHEKIRNELNSLQSRLDQLFDSQNVNTLATPIGTIQRVQNSDTKQSTWIITA